MKEGKDRGGSGRKGEAVGDLGSTPCANARVRARARVRHLARMHVEDDEPPVRAVRQSDRVGSGRLVARLVRRRVLPRLLLEEVRHHRVRRLVGRQPNAHEVLAVGVPTCTTHGARISCAPSARCTVRQCTM